MKALTTLASAAALAVTITAALPAKAAVIATFSPVNSAADYRWIKSGGSGSTAGTGGHFFSLAAIPDPAHKGRFLTNNSTVAQGVNVNFSFLDPDLLLLSNIPATFMIDGTIGTGHSANLNSAGIWTDTGLNGQFSFIYTGPTINNFHGSGIDLIANSNLLSGTFTNAWIQGAGGSGSTNVSVGNGGSAHFTSSYEHFPGLVPNSEEFALNLLSVSPSFGASKNKALNSFRANGGGNFSAEMVPEPATWTMMIVGFGAVGALVRRQRRRPVFAA